MKKMIIVDLILKLGERSEAFRMSLKDIYENEFDSPKSCKARQIIYDMVKKELNKNTCLSTKTKLIITLETLAFLNDSEFYNIYKFLVCGPELFVAKLLDRKNESINGALFEFKELENENSWEKFRKKVNSIAILEILKEHRNLFDMLPKTNGMLNRYQKLYDGLMNRTKKLILKNDYKDLEMIRILYS